MAGSPIPATAGLEPDGGRKAVVRPTTRQRGNLREILQDQPGLTDNGSLMLLYSPNRTTEAAWLCAYARLSGMRVQLTAAPATALVMERAMRQMPAGASLIVLADSMLDLPAGAVQLAGTANMSPIDFWQAAAQAEVDPALAARALPTDLVIRTLPAAELSIRTPESGWAADSGLRQGGLARVIPAGAVRAPVAQADGLFIANGAIGVNRPVTWDARLTGRPVALTVANSTVTSVACADAQLRTIVERAVHTHRTASVAGIRFGLNRLTGGFSAVNGPVNACHQGVTLLLHADPAHAYSSASADLCIELTATWDGEPGSARRSLG